MNTWSRSREPRLGGDRLDWAAFAVVLALIVMICWMAFR